MMVVCLQCVAMRCNAPAGVPRLPLPQQRCVVNVVAVGVVLSGHSSKLLTSNCRTLAAWETTTRKTQLVHALVKDADRAGSVRHTEI